MCCFRHQAFATAFLLLLQVIFVPQVATAQSGADANGLPGRGTVSVSVEALFGSIGYSDALVGDSRAPQIYATNFAAASLSAVEGTHVGPADLLPSNVGQRSSSPSEGGARLRVGYRAVNDGGLDVDGFWMNEAEGSWQRGLGGFNAGADPTTVRVTAALPLYDGNAGYAVPFDQFFRFEFRTNIFGLGAHYAPTGYWLGATLIQPTIGVRYIDMDDTFAFAGADSGLSYTHLSTGLVDETTLTPPNVAFPPYQSQLAASSETQLFGPLVGVNYTTSGRYVRISGSTRVGVLVADSSHTLSGRGLGNGFAAGFDPTITFTDSLSQTYASAVVEQTLNLDIELLRLIPPFRQGFRNCNSSLVLRLGWSILAMSDVVQTTDSIVWQGFPLTPELRETTTDWHLQTWSAGLIYQY